MKKQFLAILSAVAVAGTVITVPLVSSQADADNVIFTTEGKTDEELKSLITNGTIGKFGANGGADVDPYGGPDRTPCISAKSHYDALDGIQIKLDNVHSGDVLSAKFQLSSTESNSKLKVELEQGESPTVMLEENAGNNGEWKSYETTSAEVLDDGTVYLCIENQSGNFHVANIKVYKTSGGVSTEQPSEQASAEPTNAPTAVPSEGEWQEVFSTKDKSQDELNAFITNGTVAKYSSTEGSNPSEPVTASNSWQGNFGPCFELKGVGSQPAGIKIKIDGVKNGDSVKVRLKLQSSWDQGRTKISLLQGDHLTSLYEETPKSDPYEYDLGPVSITGDGEVYLCIEDCADTFFVDNIEVYKKSGETEPATPTDTPTPTAEPTEKPTDEPKFTCEPAKFEKINDSLDGDLRGAELIDGGHVIKSADGTSVVSVWKCVFTGDAPDGLYVTATSESTKKTGYTTVDVGGTDMAISGDGAVTFYVLVNSSASDIKFEATTVHVE